MKPELVLGAVVLGGFVWLAFRSKTAKAQEAEDEAPPVDLLDGAWQFTGASGETYQIARAPGTDRQEFQVGPVTAPIHYFNFIVHGGERYFAPGSMNPVLEQGTQARILSDFQPLRTDGPPA